MSITTVHEPATVLLVQGNGQRLVVMQPQTDRILVREPDAIRVVKELERVLVVAPGPRGATGPAGPSRPADAREVTFATASDSWTVQHDLGFTPAVGTYDSHGVQITGVVVENGPGRTVVAFYYPTAGRMTLS